MEFCRLPIRFDLPTLQREALQFGAQEWLQHPTGYSGNSAIRLITVRGTQNDDVAGPMAATGQLGRCPYIQRVLAQFGVTWSRSRLMKLAPRSVVPAHSDVNFHWFNRVRIHIPIVTRPGVMFHCGQQSVHMASGEAWIFDNWRRHRVENSTDQERIHLVADTTGNAAFWNLVRRGQTRLFDTPEPAPLFPCVPEMPEPLLTEQYNTPVVMPPAEVETLLRDLSQDLAVTENTPAAFESADDFRKLLLEFCEDWRHCWSQFADSPAGWPRYRALCENLKIQVAQLPVRVYTDSNQVAVGAVLDARVLRYAVTPSGSTAAAEDEYSAQPA